MTLMDYPNMKDQPRRKLHREVYKIAYPESFEQNIKKTSELKGV